MKIFLLDIAETRLQLLPLTYTRSIGELRVGILKIHEKWSAKLGAEVNLITEPYLGKTETIGDGTLNLIINASLCPDDQLIKALENLQENQKLTQNGKFLASKAASMPTFNQAVDDQLISVEHSGKVDLIERPWDIFIKNGDQIRLDFDLLTKGQKSIGVEDPYTRIYNEKNIFLEKGAEVKAAILNAENGPIYIGKNTKIHEGSIIRGPFALCEYGQVNMGAKIRGDSTFGPHTKVGGEVANSVIMGYSNKGHDGYLGSSVIGEWCNLGADTNTSNMKNNYTQVKMWDYTKDSFINTGLQFCGLIMGDHSKCGINTMFNTGTVVGVSANIFGSGYPGNVIPSFSWGGSAGFTTYRLDKAKETATIAMRRKTKGWTDPDDGIFEEIFKRSEKYRVWENKNEL
ncbi:GlmU family protein [Reichenbachiella sp. MALMAid0571]|uniref:GlmU family protein n=1 Tax=Reichenbachiella sp. MALMAid0571 TaxID=3143939 RepID=UPI0032DF2569